MQRVYSFIIPLLLVNLILAQSAMQGTYTIGGDSPDFITIQEAADSLMSQGIDGPVILNIRAGIYEESDGSQRALHIPGLIPGSSIDTTITIQADEASGANAENTILRRTSGGDEVGWVAYIRCSFVTINNLTFEYANSDTNISGVQVFQDNIHFQPDQATGGQASIEHITVRSCRMISSGPSRPSAGIKFSTGGRHILIENNFIQRSGDGIYIERCGGCADFSYVTITNNIFRQLLGLRWGTGDYNGTGIYISNGSVYNISGNDLDYEFSSYNGIRGIQVFGSDVTIVGNRIRSVPFQANIEVFNGFTGIDLQNASGSNLIANNMISGIIKNANGIHVYNCSDVDIIHNSIMLEKINTGWTIKMWPLVIGSSSNVMVMNNIFVSQLTTSSWSESGVYKFYGSNSNLQFDYNTLYSEGSIMIDDVSSDYTNLEEWQVTGHDENSNFFTPEFVSSSMDLHLTDCSLGDERLWGMPLESVLIDYDSESRDTEHPYMGADEVDGSRPDLFEVPSYYDLDATALFFTTGDFDGDEDEDIAAVDNYSNDTKISVFWNDGSGAFNTSTTTKFSSQTTIIRAADLDGDSYDDIVATDNDSLMIRWGMSGGTFSPIFALSYSSIYGSTEDLKFTDLDNDGDLDIVQVHFGIVDVDSGWVTQIMNEGGRNFSFSNGIAHRAGFNPGNIAVAHLNDDELPDIVVNDYIHNKVVSFINMGGGPDLDWIGYLPLQEIDVPISTSSLHKNFDTGDIDGDGDDDVVLGKWVEGTDSLVFLKNDGNGVFSEDKIFLDARRSSKTFELFDYENDGDPDIIYASALDDIVLYLNDGYGNFEIQRLCQLSDLMNSPSTIMTADLNNDNHNDILVLSAFDFMTMLNARWVSSFVDNGSENASIPKSIELEQNYPNPFNPKTTISYAVRAQNLVPQQVDLSIYNALGQKIATLVSQKQAPVEYKVQWNPNGLPSGVYFYKLSIADGKSQTRKMILIK